jgi:hypothetical protein
MPDLVMTLVLLILRGWKKGTENQKNLIAFQGNTTSSDFDLNITNVYLYIAFFLKVTDF